MQAMIFAAGLGTRLRPLTDNKPKALVEINGKTLLERNIEKLVSYGIDRIVVNIHHFPEMMIQAVEKLSSKYNCNIIISDESSLLLNTGGGLLHAGNKLSHLRKSEGRFSPLIPHNNSAKGRFISAENSDGAILLHNVDILSDVDFADMYRVFTKQKPLALLAVQNRTTQRYLIFNEDNELCGWTNTATKEKILTRKCRKEQLFAFSGIHIVSYDIFEKIHKQGVFSITDLYLELSADNIIKPYIHNGLWLDVGKLPMIEKACEMFQN